MPLKRKTLSAKLPEKRESERISGQSEARGRRSVPSLSEGRTVSNLLFLKRETEQKRETERTRCSARCEKGSPRHQCKRKKRKNTKSTEEEKSLSKKKKE